MNTFIYLKINKKIYKAYKNIFLNMHVFFIIKYIFK